MPRFNLPDVTFTEKSALQVETDIVNRFAQITGIRLAQADPRRKFIQALVPIIAQQRVLIDYSAKQNLLAYSAGNMLDHVGALTDAQRLQSAAAVVAVRFNLSTAFQRTIASNTQVTAGDGVFFATTESTTVEGGQTFVDVECQCTQTGAIGNGYLPGEINQLVSPISWVTSVENITESDGGAEVETDDPYAERIQLSPEKFSTAGPDGAYIFWARTASQLIVDVSVISPVPGEVEIRPLLANGGIPGQGILDAVDAICNDRRIRPLTDKVTVLAPTQVSYNITLTYYINTNDSSIETAIQEAVSESIEGYKTWQKSKLGRDIDPSELIARVKNAGAKRVTATLPVYTQLNTTQVASDGIVTATYGGLEDG